MRRHPLFNRLAKPLPPIYPDAVTPVAWDDDNPLEEVEGVVYLVSRSCAVMRDWAKKLRALYRLDKTYKTDAGFSPLSLKPLDAAELRSIGEAELSVYGRTWNEVRSVQSGHYLYLTLPLMAVVLDRAGGNPVGFVSFRLKWTVSADRTDVRGVDLEIEPGQAWITPEFRGRGWGELVAIAIAMTASQHINQLQDSTRWPKGFTVPMKVTVGADIYSTSGERFLLHCASYMAIQLDMLDNPSRFEIGEVDFDPRW